MGEQETAGEQVLEAERPQEGEQSETAAPESASGAGVEDVQQLILESTETRPQESEEARELAVLEAIVYVTDEPLPVQQIASALGRPVEQVQALLDKLVAEYNKPEHGLGVREIAGGYKMATKPEHHEAVRQFVKNLNPPLKLSLAALETLAVIAYKQPITGPEIMEIRGVQGAGVLKTLLDRKLITSSGRKNVVGRPILYKTTKDFLVQFGLKDLNELPTLKEFEELRRLALGDENETVLGADAPQATAAAAGDDPEVARQSDDPEAPATPLPDAEETAEPAPEKAAAQENSDIARQPEDPEAPAAPPPEPEQPPEREPEPESPGKREREPEIPKTDPEEHG